jgi:hypothetical protein
MLGLAGKVVSGFLNVTMMLFSSYQGNNPSFSEIFLHNDLNNINIRTELVSAFDNDFQTIFKSGKPIIIYFSLTTQKDKEPAENHTFAHVVVFHPLKAYYQINLGPDNNQVITESYEELLTLISHLEFIYSYSGEPGVYHFTLTASLDKIRLDTMDRDFDMMMLWNFKQPRATFSYKVEIYES